MIKTLAYGKSAVQYSDRGKLLADKNGMPYITAWIEEEVTETDIDCDKAEFAEVMAEIGAIIN